MPPASSASSTARSDTSEPTLAPFIAPTFDPTAYLNSTLPPLAIVTATQPIIPSKALSLPDVTARTQTHVAQLSAQTARLTTTLTGLTDDILRSGSRLAYEVELLRGEAVSLKETLAEKLADDIEKFISGGLAKAVEEEGEEEEEKEPRADGATERKDADATSSLPAPLSTDSRPGAEGGTSAAVSTNEPPSLTRLRSLHLVRSRLQSVISTFGLALSWPLPPSHLSSSSLLSISDPSEPGLEEKGQAALTAIRASVMDQLATGGAEGVLRAEARVDELRELVGVWKGTAEEKARGRVVDGLAKVVAERRAEAERMGTLAPREAREDAQETGQAPAQAPTQQGRGLFGGLRRLREEIYLE